MKINHTYAIYFSPTDASKKSAISIARGLDGELEEIDLTLDRDIPEMRFTRNDVVVMGFPVYGGRILPQALARLKSLTGDHTACVITVTYGNRHYDDALIELFDYVRELGFIPIAGAALVGEHTYGHIQGGRPNRDDMYRNELFGGLVRLKIKNDNFIFVSVPGKYPYKDGKIKVKFYPELNGQCNRCGLCVKMCPVDAIDKETLEVDKDKCISCFRCVKRRLTHGRNMDNNEEYQKFSEEFSKRLAKPRENEYFI